MITAMVADVDVASVSTREPLDGGFLDGAIGFHEKRAKTWSAAYRRSEHFRRRVRDWRAAMETYVAPSMTVLDAGCGSGDLSRIAARMGADVTGVDASPAMIAEARDSLDRFSLPAGFDIADVRDLPYDGQSFDLVLASSVLEYVEPLDGALIELRRVLRPDGILICSLPNAKSLYRVLEGFLVRTTGRPAYRRHVNELVYKADLEQIFANIGFEIVERRYSGAPPRLGAGAVGDFAQRHPRLATMILYIVRRVDAA